MYFNFNNIIEKNDIKRYRNNITINNFNSNIINSNNNIKCDIDDKVKRKVYNIIWCKYDNVNNFFKNLERKKYLKKEKSI